MFYVCAGGGGISVGGCVFVSWHMWGGRMFMCLCVCVDESGGIVLGSTFVFVFYKYMWVWVKHFYRRIYRKFYLYCFGIDHVCVCSAVKTLIYAFCGVCDQW